MATSNPTDSGCGRFRFNHEEDDALEAAVLRLVLEFHPDAFTKDELLREITQGGSTEFSEVDANERAVRDLAAAGLLHPLGDEEFVRPTRAALRFLRDRRDDRLMAGGDKYQALIEALGHPIRRRVLRRYLESSARLSPKELADSEKLSLSLVGYHVRRLQKLGAVELVGHRQRRGACQHFYRPTSLVKGSTLIRVALGMKAG